MTAPHRVAHAAYLLVLALWVGGGAFYTFVATPAIFRAYGRNRAGEVVGVLMPHYFAWMLLSACAAAGLLLLLWTSPSPRLRALCLGLALAGILVQGYVNFGLYPRILAAKAQVASFEADTGAPARVRFRRLHGASMLLNLLTLADGAALLALAPLLRR